MDLSGSYTTLVTSNQVPRGQLLMSDAQIDQLRRHLQDIHDHFEGLYNPGPDEPFAMEIEFKITSDDVLSIKQARPWVFGVPNAPGHGGETPEGEAIWSATLTVGVEENFAGYSSFAQGEENNTLGALSSDTITLDDASYTVKALGVLNGKLILSVIPRPAAGFVLVVGTSEFASADASTLEGDSISIIQFQWNHLGLDLSEGEEVAVRLAAPDDGTPATGLPVITGTARVGQTLTVDTSAIADEDELDNVSYSYQWIRNDGTNDADIGGQTGSTYTLTDEDELDNVSYSYQWIRNDGTNDADIGGQTGSTYTLTDEDVGKSIKVRVSFTDDADHEETLTSAATGVVAAKPNSPATGAPTIDGTAQVGETLTVLTNGITDEDGLDNVSYSYQWIRNDGTNDADIGGQTGSIYTLTDEDVGKSIKVRVSFTDDADHAETRTSEATDTVAATKPGVPEHLNAFPHDAGALDVYWEAPTSDGGSDITGYKVQWKESADSWDTPADVSEATASGTIHTITGLTDGVEYSVRVLATNGVGDSPPSVEQTGTPRETKAPEMVRPRVDGATLKVLYDEALDEGSAPPTDSFDVRVACTCDDTTWLDEEAKRAVESVSVDGDTVVLTLVSAATSEDVVVVSYTPPSDASTTRTRDLAGNAAAGFNSTEVFNDTDETAESEENGEPEETTEGETPLTVSLEATTESHNGTDAFTFELRFSEEVELSYVTLRDDDAFSVTDGEVTGASRLDKPSNLRWQIVVEPDSDADVTIVLPPTTNCGAQGAICTGGGKKLSGRVELTVNGPEQQNQERQNNSATGAPAISGTPQVEETLTADTANIDDEDGLTNATFEYQWIAGGADISGATGASHTLTAAEERQTIQVRVDFTDDAGNAETLTSAATVAVEPKPNSEPTGLPAIPGTPQVGETLTADTSAIDDADGLTSVSYGYQSIANDGTADTDLQEATASSYTPRVNDVGKTIKVSVSFTDDANNDESLTSVATAAVAATVPTEPLSLTMTRGSQIQELDASWQAPASNGGSAVTGYKVQWKEAADSWDTAADVSQATETGTTHTVTGLTGGVEYTVRVMATNDVGDGPASTEAKGTPAGGVSEQTVEPENTVPTGLPTISGTPQVGETLTADTSGISDAEGLTSVSYRYQWTAGGSDISGATGSSHLLTSSQRGQTVQVKVTFTDDADNQESLTSAETLAVAAKPNTAATGEPTISGAPRVNDMLTAGTSAISDEDGLDNVSYRYQWLADDAEIAGATGSTYTLADADEDKAIRVQVTFTDDAGNAESLTSTATTPIAAQPAETPAVLLTASFANVPADHNGSNFTFQLSFSENVEAGYARIRDHAFAVTGATIDSASRITQGSNQGWNVEVNPTGNGSVSITLPETTDCDASGAICTDDSRTLSQSTSATVAGPPAIAISDATVQEAEGAVLVFTATLSHASSRTVTVDYATSDGTAAAGSDYTAASGALTFNAGDTSQTVQVTVLTDSEDESQETLTLTLSNPSQATLDDATGTGAIENGESSSGTQEDPPAEDPPAETPVVLLTASFGNMPATHNGSAFTFDLTFSEEFGISYVTLRDDAFSVTGGTVENAQRTDKPSNISWRITVKPTSTGDVTVVLPVTTDCNASGAVCTADGRKLSNRLEFTVSGPSG